MYNILQAVETTCYPIINKPKPKPKEEPPKEVEKNGEKDGEKVEIKTEVKTETTMDDTPQAAGDVTTEQSSNGLTDMEVD